MSRVPCPSCGGEGYEELSCIHLDPNECDGPHIDACLVCGGEGEIDPLPHVSIIDSGCHTHIQYRYPLRGGSLP